jgi:glycosyltransferase 2 family protein
MSHAHRSRRRLVFLSLKATVAAILLWLLLRRVPVQEAFAHLREARWWLVAAFSPLFVLQTALLAWRWRILSDGLISYGAALKYTWIGFFYGTILPGGASGDIAKGTALALKDKDTRAVRLPVSILLDRVVGFWCLLLLAAAGSSWQLFAGDLADVRLREAIGMTAALCLGGAGAGVAVLSAPGLRMVQRLVGWLPRGRVASHAHNALGALAGITADKRGLSLAVLLSLTSHLLSVASYLVSMHAVGLPLPFASALTLYAITSVIVMVPLTISGIGLRDWFTVLYYETLGLSGSAGLAFTWLSLLCGFCFAAVGGVVQLWEMFQHPARSQSES